MEGSRAPVSAPLSFAEGREPHGQMKFEFKSALMTYSRTAVCVGAVAASEMYEVSPDRAGNRA